MEKVEDSSAPPDRTIKTSSISPERPPLSPPPRTPNSPPPAQSSTSHPNQRFAANFSSPYHSIFPLKSPRTSSTVITPSPCPSASSDEQQNAAAATSSRSGDVAVEHRLNEARLVLEYQQLRDHYDLSRAHLSNLTDEIDSLRREMAELRMANAELVGLLRLPSQTTVQNRLRRLGLINHNAAGSELSCEDFASYSPTSVMNQGGYGTSNLERVCIPKSVPVRSSGFLKSNQPASSGGSSSSAGASCQFQRPTMQESMKQQRLVLPGSKKEREALELEVYGQGMFKTELCNRWQETGACPYRDHCQFAHGIAELRPVIRHPRYTTEVCRMVLAGNPCPYGHRCHYRHSLTEQERRAMLAPR